MNDSVKINKTLPEDQNLPRISVTYQKRVDTADFGKNAITLSKTVTVSILPDNTINGDLAEIIKASDLIEEALTEDVNNSAKMIRAIEETAPQVSVAKKTSPYSRNK